MELKILWGIISRRKWIMLQTFLLISLTVIVATSQLPSVYESKTVLLFETQSSIAESFLLAKHRDDR